MKALPLHDMRRSPQDFETGRVTIAREADVYAAPAEPEVEQGDVGQPGRQLGIHEDAATRGVERDAENRLQQREHRPRSPVLWDVVTEVLHRKIGIAALHARIEFRQLIEQELTGGTRNVAGDLANLVREAVSLQAECDHAVVVRPDRAVL